MRGKKKMIEDERDFSKILEQMTSIRSSVDATGLLLVSCMLHSKIKNNLQSNTGNDYSITETMKPFLKRLIE
ncbi:MAG: metal-sensing transcriptional repressor [Vampirovibrionia bacterium]